MFAPGINIIVGKNNSGKSSLLEAMKLKLENIPNISSDRQYDPPTMAEDKVGSNTTATFCISGKEILEIISGRMKAERFSKIKLSSEAAEIASTLNYPPYQDKIIAFVEYLFQNTMSIYFHFNSPRSDFLHTLEEISYDFMDFHFLLLDPSKVPPAKRNKKGGGEKNDGKDFDPLDMLDPSFGVPEEELSISELLNFVISDFHDLILNYIIREYNSKSYRFRAERSIQDSVEITNQSETILRPDASNLSGFLHYLQGSWPEIFEDINECLRLVLPEIKGLSVRQNDNNYEVVVWFHCLPERPRGFKLSQCGSGVGQVIAILCVVIAMGQPSYIFIDEPQSFLHPGAARNLIEILKLYSHHQYFITTHSPDVVRASEPASLTLLSCENLSSTAETLDKDSLADLRFVLSEVGLKFSDFFGADQILWVEGPTEEKCFPLILRQQGDKYRKTGKPLGLEILSVISVGDFEAKPTKRAELIFDVYDKLGTGSSLFPPAAGFIFDRELRTDSEMQDLEKRRPGQVKFIPRRMYENYLLSPKAIAYVLKKHDIYEDKEHSSDEVKDWIVNNHSQYSSCSYDNTPDSFWEPTVECGFQPSSTVA
jgi:AAA15 family ATPase/GTPase